MTVRAALVGCGRLAELGYLPAFEQRADVALVAVADPDAGRRGAIATRAGVPGHPDLGAVLDGIDVDAVVIASPAAAHLADATTAVAAGLAVLVEKPPAPDVAGAARLAELGRSVHVGFNRRYDAGVRAVRGRVPADGAVELSLGIRYRRASWNPHTAHDEVLDDLGPHLVDLARWLTGSDVLAVTARTLTADRAELELRLDRGWARIECAADRHHAEHVVVARPDGAPLAEHRVGGPLAAVTGRVRAVADRVRGGAMPHPLVESLAAQLGDLARAVRGESTPDLGTATDGLAVMQVLAAARASAADASRPVAVDPSPSVAVNPNPTPERRPC